MLTEQDITKIFMNGDIQVYLVDKYPNPKDLYANTTFGECDTTRRIIWGYMENMPCDKELGITLIHEMIHFRDEFYWNQISKISSRNERKEENEEEGWKISPYEQRVEDEAIETYKKNPEILSLIAHYLNLKLESALSTRVFTSGSHLI